MERVHGRVFCAVRAPVVDVSAQVYRYDWSSGTIEDTGWIPPSPVDLSDVEVTDLRVPARDGTLIPLCVLHHKGLMLDGSSPVVLTGYGSHGWVQPREFSPQWLAWYERGGVYAVAGLRGGGDYGRPWHEAGRGPNKERTITDFIDCAEHLIAAGYTRPGRLAGMGGSAAASRPEAHWYACPTCGPRWCCRYR